MFNSACGTAESVDTSTAEPAGALPQSSQPSVGADRFESIPDASTLEQENASGQLIGESQGSVLPVFPQDNENGQSEEPSDSSASVALKASCSADDETMQSRILQLINDARNQPRTCGLTQYSATTPLTWNAVLASAASKHSIDMAEHNFFSHIGSDGSRASQRVTREGYNWRTVGENIAAGRDSAEQTINDWLDSEGHCHNIMNPAFSEVAVSCIEDDSSDYQRYWTNLLAAPM